MLKIITKMPIRIPTNPPPMISKIPPMIATRQPIAINVLANPVLFAIISPQISYIRGKILAFKHVAEIIIA
jgi:hypothetical protein